MSIVKTRPAFVAAHLNPFASRYVNRIPFFFESSVESSTSENWSTTLQRLIELNYRASIVGPKGTGKTTLLEQVPDHLPNIATRLISIDRDPTIRRRQFSEMKDGFRDGLVLLVDCFERLSRWQKFRLVSMTRTATESKGGLIVTWHEAGPLPVWIERRTNEQTLRHVLNHLPVSVSDDLLQSATRHFAIHRGNIRQTLLALYDDFAEGKLPDAR